MTKEINLREVIKEAYAPGAEEEKIQNELLERILKNLKEEETEND